MPGGRPRQFVEAHALDRALELFWTSGYEGISVNALSAAMGVNKPSLYATFGSKEELFRRVVQLYTQREMHYAHEALQAPTAREVVRQYLLANADALTKPDRPRGCLTLQGGLSCAPENAAIRKLLAASRVAGERALADRLRLAVEEGDLPASSDPDTLARFVMTYSQGQAVHASDGATTAELRESAEVALRVFDQFVAGSEL